MHPLLTTLSWRSSSSSRPMRERSKGKVTVRHTSMLGSVALFVTPRKVMRNGCKSVRSSCCWCCSPRICSMYEAVLWQNVYEAIVVILFQMNCSGLIPLIYIIISSGHAGIVPDFSVPLYCLSPSFQTVLHKSEPPRNIQYPLICHNRE